MTVVAFILIAVFVAFFSDHTSGVLLRQNGMEQKQTRLSAG